MNIVFTFEKTCDACPLQLEGTIEIPEIAFRRYWYFRHRHGHYWFGIGESLMGKDDGAVGVALGWVPGFRRQGEWPEEMTERQARKGPIPKFLSEFFASGFSPISAADWEVAWSEMCHTA